MVSGYRATWWCIALCCLQKQVCAAAIASPNITFNNILDYGAVVSAKIAALVLDQKVFMCLSVN